MEIITATIDNLEDLLPLFDSYRKFYAKPSDVKGAKAFLTERFENNEATIFMAYDGNTAMGFLTLYPTFSSVSMKGDFLLNDLFVAKEFRGNGYGGKLLQHAQAHAIETNSKGLLLETALDNPAQYLYEKMDFKKTIEGVYHYYWEAK